jgi:hypothetical protein
MLTFKCSKCGAESTPGENYDSSSFRKCSCGSRSYSEVFPAIKNELQKGERPELALNEEATCFMHAANIAVAACDYCGVYMCKLCDLEIENHHICPNCLKEKPKKLKTATQKTFLYDDLAIHLTVLPFLFFSYAFLITAPMAVGICLFCRNKINTPYKRSRWRFNLALILGCLEVFGLAALIYSISRL